MVEKGLKVATGLIHKTKTFYLDPDNPKNDNSHLLIVGGSGSGKTTLLKEVIKYLYEEDKTIFIIDYHGDLKTDNENLLEFTPRNSPYGINPFEIELDEKSGGVDIQAELIAIMMDTYFIDNMGKKQENILKRLVLDTYAIKGIFDNDPSTWTKELPTMKDLHDVCKYIISCLENPENNEYITENINKKFDQIISSLSSKKIKEKSDEESIETLINSINNNKKEYEKIIENVPEFNIEEEIIKFSVIELEYYQKPSIKRSFESLFSYIEEVSLMSIFSDNKPKLLTGVNRLDFSAFTAINKPLTAKFLSEFIAQKLFRSSMIRGEYDKLENKKSNTKFDRVLIIDESKLAMPHGREKDNPYNIMNRIVSESRKYGFMLGIVSQRLNHYTEEILSNIYTKIILKTKPNDFKTVSKVLGVDIKMVSNTFETEKGYPAIIETSGANKYSYLIEDFRAS